MHQRVLVHRRQLRQEVDLVVISDQCHFIGRCKPPNEKRCALLGDLELGPGHGPRAVEHEGQVERGPFGGLWSRRALDFQHCVNLMLGLHGKQLVF